ncbi:RHS repeat-associated core domain-containing protein, partial [Galbibacter marinus]
AQRWKYNGKEYDESLDINTYDFGARNYNPAIGRWMNIDPMADLMKRVTPYNYTFNNPIKFIDPNGMAPIDPPGSGTDNDPFQLEPITVSANSKSGSRGWSSESLTAFSGSLDQYKRQYEFTGDYENVKEQYSNKYGNSYESPKYNSMEGVDFNSFKANWNMGYLGWEDGSIGVFLMDVTTYSIGGTLLSTTLLPYAISGGGLQSALGKSTISGIVQYSINDQVNVVAAFSDGFLMPGIGDALGAGFEVNIDTQLNIGTTSILGSKSGSSVLWEAGVGTIFGVKMEGLNNVINKSEASNFAKGVGKGMFETGTKATSYGILSRQ